MIVKKKGEDSSCQIFVVKEKMGERTVWRVGEEKKGNKWVTGPAEKERVFSVLQSEQLARTPEPSWPKGKGTETLPRSPDCTMSENRILARERGMRAKAWGGKG